MKASRTGLIIAALAASIGAAVTLAQGLADRLGYLTDRLAL